MKKFNLFLTQWENASPRPSPLSHRQKEMQLREAVRGTLTWYGWSGTETTPEKNKKSSPAADEKSSPGSYRWIAFTKPPHCLLWKKLWYDTMESYHGPQNIGYYVFDTVLLSNRINAKQKLLAYIPQLLIRPYFNIFWNSKTILLVWCTALQWLPHY